MHQRLAALAAVLLVPSLASGQATDGGTTTTTGVTVRESSAPTQIPPIVNIAECKGTTPDGVAITWTVPTNVFQQASGGRYEVFVSDTSGCPTNQSNALSASLGTVPANAATAAFPGNGTYSVPQLLATLQIAPACTPGKSVVYVCINWNPAAGLAPTNPILSGTISLDLGLPNAPEQVVVTPADQGLRVSWAQGTGTADAGSPGSATGYRVYYVAYAGTPPDAATLRDAAFEAGTYVAVTGASTLSTRINGLTNGQSYAVVVTALTEGLNESLPSSTPVTGVPIAILDFWRAYQTDGGRELGGCSSGAASLLALLVLVPIAIGARRSSRRRS